MNEIRPTRVAVLFAVLFGLFHLGWLILVLVGAAQPLMDFVFRLHMIKPIYVIEPFNPLLAIGLLIFTAACGYITGLIFGITWNLIHSD